MYQDARRRRRFSWASGDHVRPFLHNSHSNETMIRLICAWKGPCWGILQRAKRIVYRTEKERKNIMQERKINPFQQTRQDEKSQKNCMKVQTKGCKEEEKDCKKSSNETWKKGRLEQRKWISWVLKRSRGNWGTWRRRGSCRDGGGEMALEKKTLLGSDLKNNFFFCSEGLAMAMAMACCEEAAAMAMENKQKTRTAH